MYRVKLVRQESNSRWASTFLALRVRNKDGLRATNGLIPLTCVTLLLTESRVLQAITFR